MQIKPVINNKVKSFIVWSQVIIQIITPIYFIFPSTSNASSPFSADRNSNQTSNHSTSSSNSIWTDDKQPSGSQDATSVATNMASSAIGNSAEQWLSQFGTAQVKLRTDSHFTLEGSSLDLLVPLYDTSSDVIFTQGGIRYNDNRLTTNLGVGHRHFFNDWMLGYNAFYDATWNDTNRRWGVGVEAWRDNLRLSGNIYRGITDWHNSQQHDGYDERPANGWDIRTEGWLPAYPQLGVKAIYEQYYGENVSLFNSFSDRQKDPNALTVGVNYTPFPLITLGVDYKRGSGGVHDTPISLALNYRFGEPWSKQISPANVASLRELSNSRLDLVNRNNEIVMDYRKQELLQLSFPPRITGEEYSTFTFTASVRSDHELDHLELDDTALFQAGGQVISVTNGVITLKLPASTSQAIRLSGVAVDRKGNRSNIAETLINTTKADNILSLTTNKTTAVASGSDAITATLHVIDTNGKSMAGQAVNWTTTGGTLSDGVVQTDEEGKATIKLTSTTPGSFTITATVGGKTTSGSPLLFSAIQNNSPLVQLSVDKISVLIDKPDKATYTIIVKDPSGQPVAGETVTWGTDLGTLSSQSGKTDANGRLQVTLTSTTIGLATVTANVIGQNLTSEVRFVIEFHPILLEVDKMLANANGKDAATYTVTITDSQKKPVVGETVTWETNLGTFSARTGTTDANGKLQVKLTSTEAGSVTITVITKSNTMNAFMLTFIDEILRPKLIVDKNAVKSDGTDSATYTLTLTDSDNQPIAGQTVSWSTDFGTLSSQTGTTDANGRAQVKLTSTKAGTAMVTASVEKQERTTSTVTFAEEVLALIPSITIDKYYVKPDGTDAVTYTVTVKNTNNQPVAGQDVSWSTDFGTLSAQSGTTDANGQVKVKLTSTTVGYASVTANVAGQSPTAYMVSFAAEVLTSAMTTDKTGATADGIDAVTYTVTVKNANNHPVAGQAVSLNTNFGTLSAQSGTTDANGQVKVKLTSTATGSAIVTATAAGRTLTAYSVTFDAETLTPTITVDKTAR